MTSETKRVLSIQSHVVHGHVGNKSATFPLQLLGFDVDPINTVHFSNHTHYAHWDGQKLTANDLNAILDPLFKNGVADYTHLLTGYTASVNLLNNIGDLVEKLKKINPSLIYVCDPVMGDNGKMYLPDDILAVYRDRIIPLADIITPNQFEAEILTGHKIHTLADAKIVFDKFHAMGIKTVLLSSTNLGPEDKLMAIGSHQITPGQTLTVTAEIPKLPAFFVGTGDLFAALFLAWMQATAGDLRESLEKTLNTMHSVLKRTYAYAETRGVTSKNLELKLVQSRDDIVTPASDIVAQVVQI